MPPGGADVQLNLIIGAFFLTFLLEYLRPWLPGAERYFVYGGIALLLFVYQPKGFIEIFGKAIARVRGAA